jgi:hypothetical protein
MIGTVPIYDAIGYLEKDLAEITAQDFLRVVRAHAEEGVDFMTIHAGITAVPAATQPISFCASRDSFLATHSSSAVRMPLRAASIWVLYGAEAAVGVLFTAYSFY